MQTRASPGDAPDRATRATESPNAGMEGTSVEGIFGRRKDLRKAVNGLMARGVPTNTIRVYLVDGTGRRRRELSVESGSGALKGALIGAGVGAIVGLAIVVLALGGVFGPTSVEVLGVRSILGGTRAVVLGAAAGVPFGALLGMGHWQGAHRIPEADFKKHRASVVVASDAKADVAREVLREAGAHEVTADLRVTG